MKKLKISQNSQENTCARVSFLIKLQVQKRSWTSCVCYFTSCVYGERVYLKKVITLHLHVHRFQDLFGSNYYVLD